MPADALQNPRFQDSFAEPSQPARASPWTPHNYTGLLAPMPAAFLSRVRLESPEP
jgi:hypothetical protein